MGINYNEDENWFCWYAVHESIKTQCKIKLNEFDEPYDEGLVAGKNDKLRDMVEILHFYQIEPIKKARMFSRENDGFELIPEEGKIVQEKYNLDIRPRMNDGEFQIFS